MHIAIDDTYGPEGATRSKYVTGARRTHVAVLFQDHEIESVRSELNGCLQYLSSQGFPAEELHFTDIYNRRGPWRSAKDEENLSVIAAFAHIYKQYKWSVLIQTVDDRTFEGVMFDSGRVASFDLKKREDLSLLYLLVMHVKPALPAPPEKTVIYIDEGRRKSGATLDSAVFGDERARISGRYCSSKDEPLLQIADFLAFAINRNTYLALKDQRSDLDNWFIDLVAGMEINSPQMQRKIVAAPLSVEKFDQLHSEDRKEKGLE